MYLFAKFPLEKKESFKYHSMKTPITIMLGFIILPATITAQKQCLVLKPQIASKYEGECKNGLAQGQGKASGVDTYEGQFRKGLPNGKGTYIWSYGDSYTGEWVQGFREGEGSYTFKSNGQDTTITGLWEKDNYIGPKPEKPKVTKSSGVDRYTFNKRPEIKNRVLIDFYQNGIRNRGIENLIMYSSSGYETKLGESIGYDEVTFPVTMKLNYTTWNKLHGAKIHVIFEFKIFEQGDWRVNITN